MFRALVLVTTIIPVSLAGVALYGQCGGQGWAGSTSCDQGVCSFVNEQYSHCAPDADTATFVTTDTSTLTTTTPTATIPTTTNTQSSGTNLPSYFSWNSTDQLIGPKPADGRDIDGIKDPSIIYVNGTYHVFTSTASDAGYSMLYLNFTDFSQASSAPFYYLDQAPLGTGYRAAPQVFYMSTQNLWYLIYENGNAGYSTNPNISDPSLWTAPTNFYNGTPTIIQDNIGSGYWVDMWVICDSTDCHLFSSDDNGHLYRSQTPISDFPNGMSDPVIAKYDDNPYNLFEASNVYKVGDQYLLIVECIDTDGHRYFRSWSGTSLSGSWTPLAATQSDPFAGSINVAFNGTPWTQDISHGEMIRTNVDETMSISTCGMRYLYQGMAPNSTGDYNALPWRLALLTQTSPC